VSAILAFAHLLDGEEDPTAEERRRFARRIGESGDLLAALVNDLLDLSWIESGRLRVDIVEASAPDVVEKAVSALKEKAAGKDVTLTCRCPSAAFLGDPQRVQQIVLNLVSNAVKFTPEGGSVTVECASTTEAPPGFDGSRRWLRVDVRDTGVGIAPHQVARIFEPFVQGDGAPRGRSDGDGEHMGAGLGLAISRRLSELMSGTITVESALGRGSRFTLWLPQAMAGTRADEATGGSDAKEPRASARGSSVV
jgi:signal transduction histidine kinase